MISMSSERGSVATETKLWQREFPQIEEEKLGDYEQRIHAILSEPDPPKAWVPSSYDYASMTLVEGGMQAIAEFMQASHAASRAHCMVEKYNKALRIALEAEGQGLRLQSVISSESLQEKLIPLHEEASRAWRAADVADQKLLYEHYHAWRMVNK